MTTKVNFRMLDGPSVNILDFGADRTGTIDSTAAFQQAIDSFNGGYLLVPEGTYTVSGTVQLRDKNIIIKGSGHQYSTVVNTNDNEYAFDLFPVASQTGTVGVESLGIESKFGIKTRYDQDTDWENSSNPIKNIRVADCVFRGKYDDINDPSAGTPTVTDVKVLDNEGVGLQLSVTYRSDIYNNEFYRFGVGINESGNTLGSIRRNRFQKCARHIHSQRTLWSGSSFGLGAEMIIEQNDFLDATHGGGVSMFNTFGCNFRNNYMEHLDRTGSDSSPVLMYFQNTSHCNITDNHYNAFLSYTEGEPMVRYFFNKTLAIGEASNNFFIGNRLTPNVAVGNAFIQTSTTEYDSRYPNTLHMYGNSEIVPMFSVPYVCDKDQVDYSYLAYDNIGFHHQLAGTVADNTLLWEGGSNAGWTLPNSADTGGTPNLKFNLTYINYDLSDQFKIVFIHSDTPDPGNSRCFVNINDETTGNIFNGFAYNGDSGFTRTELTVTGARTLRKVFEIDLTNTSFSDIYYVGVERV